MGKALSGVDGEMRLMSERKKERKKGVETKRMSEGWRTKREKEDKAHHTQLQERLQLIIYIICHCALHWTTQQTAPVI